MRSEAMKTITKHDRELMEKIRLYRIQTQDQRDELNKEKEELADQKKDLEKKQEELQALRGVHLSLYQHDAGREMPAAS